MNKIISILQRAFSLLIVFLMLVATTITSGRIFGHDWQKKEQVESPEVITASVHAPDSLEKCDLGIDGAVLTVRDSISWTVASEEGEPLGILVSSESVGNGFEGFGGKTPVFILIGEDGKISRIGVGKNDETPHFLHIAAGGILPAWEGIRAEKAMDIEVDAVSGATYSSNALIANVKAGLSAYNHSRISMKQAPAIGWWKTAAVLLVLALGCLASWKFRGVKWIRLCILALNVIVTGFWCGQFISLSILHGWMLNGCNIITVLPTFAMLVVAILMPYLGRKSHFCTWVCPYGSLQELAFRIPVKKIKMKPSVSKWMGRIRTMVFMVLMALLWLGWGTPILNYEPFGAFLINAAAPAVMILAGSFILISIFIPRPWCRTFCPVGEMLHLAETPASRK